MRRASSLIGSSGTWKRLAKYAESLNKANGQLIFNTFIKLTDYGYRIGLSLTLAMA